MKQNTLFWWLFRWAGIGVFLLWGTEFAVDGLAFSFNHGADGIPALGAIALIALWVSAATKAYKSLRKVIG